MVLVGGVVERVGVALEQRLVHVHSAAGLAVHRLGHEGRVEVVELRDLLDDQAVGHHAVGHLERLVVAKVDLVLARADLVVAVLDLDSEALERPNRLVAQVDGEVARGLVEVGAVVDDLGRDIVLEVVVLELGTDEEGEAQVRRALQVALEHVARVALVGGSVGPHDVAEHRRDRLAVLAPRQDLQRGGIGQRHHVGLLDPGESLDRRAVEAHALGHRRVEFVDRDDEGLEEAENIGEPQVDELDVLVDDRGCGFGAKVTRHAGSRSSMFRTVFRRVFRTDCNINQNVA